MACPGAWPGGHQQLRAHAILAVAGVGLFYAMESTVAADLSRGQLRIVLEPYAPAVPGLFLYFPSRAQVSPALKAFIEVAREVTH